MFLQKSKKYLSPFFLIHFVVWVLIPIIRPSLYMDSAEAIVWGNEWTWGTNKHPPLSGWLAEIFFSIFRDPDLSTAILSQVCVLTAFFFIYKLARCFLDRDKAVLSVMLMEGIVYYSLYSMEYNVNVLSLAIVPAMLFFFYKGIEKNKMRDWMIFGLWAGLALLTKYTNGIILLCMGGYLAATQSGRLSLKKPGVYAASIIALGVFSMHLVWLLENNFYVFDYILFRTDYRMETSWIDNIYFPLRFLGAQILAMLAAIGLFAYAYFKSGAKSNAIVPPNVFLFFTGICPVLIFMIISAIGRVPLKSMWGFALLSEATILMFYCFPFALTQAVKLSVIKFVYIIMFLFALVGIGMTLANPGSSFDGREFTNEMKSFWQKEQNTPLRYVGGDTLFATYLSVYAEERPKVLMQMDIKLTPWIDEKDFLEKGALVVTKYPADYKTYRKNYPQLSEPKIKDFTVQDILGRKKLFRIYYGIIESAGKMP